ncbi:DUF2382 domain-containing protein [Calothrix sp. PCC 6303]|nr:protein of unknown function DUF2382-containing protein [Calothrix sp. PCC 6303]
MNDHDILPPNSPSLQVGEEEIIRLLAEKLVVNYKTRKVGEVTVRKVVETRIVKVPVRREKLIVEQISPEYRQLAEINLGEEELPKFDWDEVQKPENDPVTDALMVSGKFDSPKVASLLLNAIALERKHGCQQIHLTITVDHPDTQAKYQEWFDRTSLKGSNQQ